MQSSSSTGGVDSVMIAVEDLRTANIKMTQLKYAKKEIEIKDSIIKVDSIEIENLKSSVNDLNKKYNKIKKQRNILGISVIGLLGVIIGQIL